MKTDLILLASGYSRRFQGNKLLYELDGMPLIAHTLQKLSTLKPDSLIVVTQYKEIEELAKGYGAVIVTNTQACEGQSSSIRLGIERSTADQAMLCVADQPYLRLETFKKLLVLADEEHIVCITCNGILRNPAIFPRKYYRELLSLTGEQGGRQIMRKHPGAIITVECNREEVLDIDEKTDLKIHLRKKDVF